MSGQIIMKSSLEMTMLNVLLVAIFKDES